MDREHNSVVVLEVAFELLDFAAAAVGGRGGGVYEVFVGFCFFCFCFCWFCSCCFCFCCCHCRCHCHCSLLLLLLLLLFCGRTKVPKKC